MGGGCILLAGIVLIQLELNLATNNVCLFTPAMNIYTIY